MASVSEFMANLGRIVRFHRRQAKLTQLQLADLAGVGKSTVFDLEKGGTTLRIDSILAVLAVLNIDLRLSAPLGSGSEASTDPVTKPGPVTDSPVRSFPPVGQ